METIYDSLFQRENGTASNKEIKNSMINTWGYTLELTQYGTSILHVSIPSCYVDQSKQVKEECTKITIVEKNYLDNI